MRTVLLVADETVVLEGFRSLLAGSENLALETLPFDGNALPTQVLKAQADIVLVDCNRDMSLAVLSRLCAAVPHLPVLLFARNPTPELVYQAQEAGLSGLLDSRCSRAQILSALDRCGSDEFAFDRPQGVELPASKAVRMTPREGQMVCLLAQGLKNKEIATHLGISEGTVKVYLSKLFRKVGAKDRFELALFGLKNLVGGGGRAVGPAVPEPVPSGRAVSGLNTLVLSENVPSSDEGVAAGGVAVLARTRPHQANPLRPARWAPPAFPGRVATRH